MQVAILIIGLNARLTIGQDEPAPYILLGITVLRAVIAHFQAHLPAYDAQFECIKVYILGHGQTSLSNFRAFLCSQGIAGPPGVLAEPLCGYTE